MKKFEGLMFCSDIDATLTDDKNEVSAENLEAIKYFTQNGGTFTVATGRIPLTIPSVLNEYISVPVVCQNGSAIFDVHTKKYVSYKELDKRAREIATEIAANFPKSGIEVFRLYDIAFIKDNDATERHIKSEKINCDTHLDCPINEVEGPILKILFAQDQNETDILDKAYQTSDYQKEYKLLKSHIWYYEILRNDISKGEALKELCELCGFDLKNVITAGDNDNDIAMIEMAGLGYAVENATVNLKKAADRITKSNNDNAIADIIYSI